MKKWLLSLGVLASVVSAKDMTGKLALGGNTTLGGVNGLNIATQLSKMLYVDATFGLRINDDDFAWGVAPHVFLNFADFDQSNLLLGVGLNVSNDPAYEDQPLNMAVDLPMRALWYFNDHLSIHIGAGLSIDFMQAGNDAGPVEHESVVITDLRSDLLGNAGFNYWF